MQDTPNPPEVLAAVARFLKDTVAKETQGHTSFNARVAANALEMMARQLTLSPGAEADERARLVALLGREGELADLNAEFSRRIAEGEIDPERPEVRDHLWRVTLDKLAVDQPTYWGYRAALAEGRPTGRNPT